MKDDVQPQPVPGPAERDDVQSRLNRCPYCHDGVAPAESVVCRQCLTRHHASCHAEVGTCQSCGSSDVLTQTAASAEEGQLRTELAEEQRTLSTLAVVGLSLVVMLLALFGITPFVLTLLLKVLVQVEVGGIRLAVFGVLAFGSMVGIVKLQGVLRRGGAF